MPVQRSRFKAETCCGLEEQNRMSGAIFALLEGLNHVRFWEVIPVSNRSKPVMFWFVAHRELNPVLSLFTRAWERRRYQRDVFNFEFSMDHNATGSPINRSSNGFTR